MVIANPEFWQMAEKMIRESRIVIDRAKGSVHPRWPEIIYPLDYGYLENTKSPDGDGIDLWLGSDQCGLTAIFVTIDSVKRDSEIKLIISCTRDEIALIDAFYNHYDTMKGILIFREEEK